MRFSHTKRGNSYYFFKVLTADVRQMVIRESCGIKYNPVIEAFVWNSKIKKGEAQSNLLSVPQSFIALP